MITISLNQEKISIPDHYTLAELLSKHHIHIDFCAIALNQQFIPRIHHTQTILKENDSIDIIMPMQGG